MEEQTPKPKRKRAPGWKDTPEQRRNRQKARYDKQTAFAAERGYSSWSSLVTAILNGEVEISKKK